MKRAWSLLLMSSLLFFGWATVAAFAGFFGKMDTLIVPLAKSGFHENLPDGVAIVGWVGPALIFRGDEETLAKDLRQAGALLMFPARAELCLSL